MATSARLVVLLLALAPSVAADFITGQVVDAQGVGVPNVDIDVKNLGSGGTPPIFNDGTNASGFFTTTLPAGIYRVTFTPPPPPTTTHLVAEVEDVIVVGTKNMGVIVLGAGVSLSGHVQNTAGLPVAGANIDVVDEVTGDNLVLANDFTDVFGNFSVAVPANSIELRLDATPVIGPTLASQALELTPATNVHIGSVTLGPGFTLSGVVRGPGAAPVEDVDLDVLDSETGTTIFTPGDNTDENGVFGFVVPAGTWDVEVCPPFSTLLVATDVESLTVATNVALGTFQLQAGVVLSGSVVNFRGEPAAGVDVDVSLSGSGASVVTCNDDTDGGGAYAVVVPSGLLDVTFSKACQSGRATDHHTGVAVVGNTLLDGALPRCGGPERALGRGPALAPVSATSYGRGVSGGWGSEPRLVPDAGDAAQLELQGLAGSIAVLVVGTRRSSEPLLVDPSTATLVTVHLTGRHDSRDTGSKRLHLPASLLDAPVFLQLAVLDPAAPGGLALSRGLRLAARASVR